MDSSSEQHAAPSGVRTELIVVRHGETAWNAEQRMQGHTDSQLSARGRAQARALGERMRAEPFDALYSSDLARAHDTARAVAATTGHTVRLDHRLRERAFGIFEGLTRAEMQARYPEEHARFRGGDPDYAVPGGESARAFYQRSMGCFVDLAIRHAGARIMVVAHGLLLVSLYRAAHGLELMAPRRLDLVNAGLNTFHYADGVWRLITWADGGHLVNITVEAGDET